MVDVSRWEDSSYSEVTLRGLKLTVDVWEAKEKASALAQQKERQALAAAAGSKRGARGGRGGIGRRNAGSASASNSTNDALNLSSRLALQKLNGLNASAASASSPPFSITERHSPALVLRPPHSYEARSGGAQWPAAAVNRWQRGTWALTRLENSWGIGAALELTASGTHLTRCLFASLISLGLLRCVFILP